MTNDMTAPTANPTFLRLVHRPVAQCRAGVDRWVRHHEAEPAGGHGDVASFRVGVRTLTRRRVRMELRVSPWSCDGGLTTLELLPLRRTRPTERYFRRGNALLDDVVATLTTAPSVPPATG